MDVENVELAIVGGGPAGYTAAIYAARAGLRPVCIEGYASGGQIIRSGEIHNFPGYPDGIAGSELADRMREHALAAGARIVGCDASSVDLSAAPFDVDTPDRRYRAEAVVIATGARARRLGLASEDALEGRGVCYCAICDAPFFAGQRVVVVGGGDAAAEEALILSRIASRVTIVHRRDRMRASASLQASLAGRPEIEVLTPYVVTEILGSDGVTGVRLSHPTDGTSRDIDTDGVFVAIGHEPATDLFTSWIKVDQNGFLATEPGTTATNVPGVFAAGDVSDPRYRQAVTAAASGCAAAIDAERWLQGHRDRPASRPDPADADGVARVRR